MARRSGAEVGWPGSKRQLKLWMTFVFLYPGVIFLWYADPFFLHSLQEAGTQPVVLASGSVAIEDVDEEIYLDLDDAEFMNRIFDERQNEIAYCGLLNGQRMDPWLADTKTSTPDGMTFSTKNCPGSGPPGALIHTHPGGSLQLSFADRAYFTERGRKYMCVQGGRMKTVPGQRAGKIACYKKADTEDGTINFVRVPVVIRAEVSA